jgi:hypothetical protein
VDRAWAPDHVHGRVPVGEAAPDGEGWPALAALGAPPPGPRAVFLDLETTGLAGGAGTYAFLVGCGWFEDGGFRVRQWVLTAFGAERALLDDVARCVAAGDGLVTYNGRTFDVPLLENRYALHRRPAPFDDLVHLDLLHPARRVWRPEPSGAAAGGCRLTTLERTRCGFVRRGDVPGEEIPSRYFDFVRSGNAWLLADVLEHNRLDLLSLALLTARMGRLLGNGLAGATTAREALGLGDLCARAGREDEARACYARAAGLDGLPLPGGAVTRAEALRAYARACRRARLHDEAARAWGAVLALDHRVRPPHVAREAAEALAVHHEHRQRDFATARRLALETLQITGTRPRRDAARRRLARLDRKLAADGVHPEAVGDLPQPGGGRGQAPERVGHPDDRAEAAGEQGEVLHAGVERKEAVHRQ